MITEPLDIAVNDFEAKFVCYNWMVVVIKLFLRGIWYVVHFISEVVPKWFHVEKFAGFKGPQYT